MPFRKIWSISAVLAFTCLSHSTKKRKLGCGLFDYEKPSFSPTIQAYASSKKLNKG